MKKKTNTQICQEHLTAALSALPGDNRLQTAKSLIRKAMNEVSEVESKRIRHANTQNQIAAEWSQKIATSAASAVNPRKSWDALTRLIETEKKKMEPKSAPETDLGTLLG